MKAVLSSFGSSGDFNPCFGLARALKQKGVDTIFLSNPYYKDKITGAGIRFSPAGEYWDVFKMIQENPAFLHPRRGPRAVWKLVLETMPVMYQAMSELIERERPDVVACHILEYGGMLAARNRGIPYITLNPTPMGWFSVRQPGYLTFRRQPEWIRRVMAKSSRLVLNAAFQYSFGPFCRKQGVPNPFKSIDDVYENASLNLGLWSPLLRPKASDDPPNSRICGFIRDEHIKDWPDVPERVSELFDQDRKPVVVGLGSSASLHGKEIYQHAAAVCRQMERPCLLVGKDTQQYAAPDENILSADFTPYGWAFPRAGTVIHHGGLNTTAETLLAGVPALIIPHGYDQFDNALRCQKMGVAKPIKSGRVTSKKFGPLLREILDDPQMHLTAEKLSQALHKQPEGSEIASEAILNHIFR